MRHIRVLVLVTLLGLPVRSHAQVEVYDALNHLVNTVTSVQSVVTALQTILLVADSVTNLTGGGIVSTGGAYGEDIAALQGLLAEAEGLAFDLTSLEAQISSLLSLDSAPDSMRGLRERLFELRRARSQGYLYAMRVQTLIQTGMRIADRIVRMVEALAEVLGNLSGHQNANDQVAQLNQIQLIHNTTVQAFERAETVDKAEEVLVEESMQRINEQLLMDWPGRR
jgi:conjugal transfer/entry exclusion protein